MANDRPAAKGEPGTAWNDPKTPGLRLRYLATKSVWYLFYRTKAGTQRNMKLADERSLTLTAARERARELLVRVAKGEDPAGDMKSLAERPTLQTLRDDHVKWSELHNKWTWTRDIISIYKVHVLPKLGANTFVADVKEADINRLHRTLATSLSPSRANRVCDMLRKAFNLAEKWGWRTKRSNPVDIERYKEAKRNRQPSAPEGYRLLTALAAMRNADPYFVGLIELILFTGARLNEIMAARREWVTEYGLHLPDSKTGEKVIAFSELAWEAYEAIPEVAGNPYIIVGRKKGGHMVNVTKPWRRLMKAADITERLVRHDLRRFFASAGLSGADLNLDKVGGLLGHADPRTTKRYAALFDNKAVDAANRAAAEVKAIMEGGNNVVPLRRRPAAN